LEMWKFEDLGIWKCENEWFNGQMVVLLKEPTTI
jgi:hypothetical protein